jgi:hypothetical protein
MWPKKTMCVIKRTKARSESGEGLHDELISKASPGRGQVNAMGGTAGSEGWFGRAGSQRKRKKKKKREKGGVAEEKGEGPKISI